MKFEKYISSGNSFVFASTFRDFEGVEISKFCKLYNTDGLALIRPSSEKPYQYSWRFYNNDGSSALMCGNASKCVSLFALEMGLAGLKQCFLSEAGLIKTEILEYLADFSTAMVRSRLLSPALIACFREFDTDFYLISSSVPHLCAFGVGVEGYSGAFANRFNLTIEQLSYLRHKYNANVTLGAQSGQNITSLSYERGVESITLGCGSGTIATAFLARSLGVASSARFTILNPSGVYNEILIDEEGYYLASKVEKLKIEN